MMKNIFSWLKKEKPEQRSQFVSTYGYDYMNFNSQTAFTQSRSMNLAAAYRCVEVITDAIAQLPIECFQKDVQGFKREYRESPIYSLITKQPSRNCTKFTFIKTLMTSVLLKGNGYAVIERNSSGIPVNLTFIPADKVTVGMNRQNQVFYSVSGIKEPINSMDMIHILNFTYDGLLGVSTIEHAKLTLGLSMDSEAHAQGFFKGGANLAGILKVDGQITNDQKRAIASSWQSAFNASSGNPNGVAMLEGNMSYEPITVSPADAQLLETRKFNVIDVCRFFGVSPIKAFDLECANYSTVEATQLAFLTDTLAPMLEKIEEEFNRKLFANEENAGINFDESALLRTDKASQAEYFTKLINAGVLTPAEARKQLGLPFREEADKLLIQVNMTTLNTLEKEAYNEAD